ncbi:hypothetical protein ABI59_00010 [Acidobacteria bacterium Mor1]|nr:hypothetical protein ABI59_00010 [Acidobacteria bacterium Mor1]
MILAVAVALPALAEDVEKRFRLSFSAGGFDTQDEVASDSANEFRLTDRDLVPIRVIRDPRDDSGVFGDLKIQPTTRFTFTGQYAITKTLLIEASVGYQKGDVGDIEVQAQFAGVRPPEEEQFVFQIFRLPAGEMEQVPLQLTAINRFRPRAKLNPYLGAGVGYTLIGFDPSDELNELSVNMDNSIGGFSNGATGAVDVIENLTGATVDARDTFSIHLVGGAEYSIKPKWTLFLDYRYSWASRSFSLQFNGQNSLGVSVPQGEEFLDESLGVVFGPYVIASGGLIDGGRIAPTSSAPPTTDCSDPAQAINCEFVFDPDGELDTGSYYVQGGDIDYDGASLQIGVRYTF